MACLATPVPLNHGSEATAASTEDEVPNRTMRARTVARRQRLSSGAVATVRDQAAEGVMTAAPIPP